ncbi:MAG: folate family ECF transporter S component [Clostridia bacterium]|nr:folate family ECF transporter S component [Clostridia bacterium]
MNIFTKEYWITACRELKDIRRLAFAALICAVTVALDGLVKIPVLPGGLEIKVTFFIIALGCAVYGPVAGVLIAAVVDTLSFFLFPTGFAYFPGYMLTEMLVSLFYSFFLYHRKITVHKLFFAKVCTNYLAHVLLNSLWASILMNKGYLYYFWSSLIKNTMLLPLEVLVLAAFFGAVTPFFARVGLLPAHRAEELERLQFGKSALSVFGLTALLGCTAGLYYGVFKAAGTAGTVFCILSALLGMAGVILLIASAILNKKK